LEPSPVGEIVASVATISYFGYLGYEAVKGLIKHADTGERSLGQRWRDFQAHKDQWKKVKEVTEPGKQKGTTSYERTYRNKVTGEKLHTHEIKKDATGKTTHGEHPRDYSKGKDEEKSEKDNK
jgi:hypothetical protein